MEEVVKVNKRPETAAGRALRLAGYRPEDEDKLSDVIKQIAARDGQDAAAEAAERLLHEDIYEEGLRWSPRVGVEFSFFALVVSTPTITLLQRVCLYLECYFPQSFESVAYCRECLDDGSEASVQRARAELFAQIKRLYDPEWNEIRSKSAVFHLYASKVFGWFGAGVGLCAGAKAGAGVAGIFGSVVPGLGNAAGAAIGGLIGGLVGAFAGGYFGARVGEAVADANMG